GPDKRQNRLASCAKQSNECDTGGTTRGERKKHMATFTIDNEDNITVFASAEEAAQAGGATAIQFDSQAAFARVSADWPLSRVVEIWNSISGNKQVGKFADRKKAVARIWAAIQPIAERAV